jgi:two-component system sensor histidine kinase HydH
VSKLVRGVEEMIEKEQRVDREQRLWRQEQAGFAQVGEMAAEMAHEFKRPLASIQSAVSLLAQEYVLEDRGQLLIGAVEDQLDRLSETMRDLFALARPVAPEAEPVALREIFSRSLMQLAGHPAAEGIDFQREFPDDDVDITADPKRIEQVVVNLMLNAAEAMQNHGTMTLRYGATNGMAWLTVTDTGSGIPQSEVEKVLLPFYSTKPGGTGLGLPLVTRVVAAHDGHIQIDSQPGRGTTVRIDLPLVSPSAAYTDNRRAG